MRGVRAKAIRKAIYGEDLAPRERKYRRHRQTGRIITDEMRHRYQEAKKLWKRRGRVAESR